LGVIRRLKPAARRRHDARLFIGEVDLLLVLRTRLGRLRRPSAGLLAGRLRLASPFGHLGLVLGLLDLDEVRIIDRFPA